MPTFLVLDEPTSQLDPQSAEEVLSAILRLRDESGIGIVLAEQRLERVLQYADSLWEIDDGTLRHGEARQVLESSTLGPPIVQVGRALGWRPLPIALREARREAKSMSIAPFAKGPRAAVGETVLGFGSTSIELGGRQIIKDIDLTIGRGEIVALMGRNGSGKTTLLRGAAGLLKVKPDNSVMRPARCAYVPQSPKRVLFRKSVRAEIAATLKARGLRHDEVAIASIAGPLRLQHLLDKFPLDLSGGERTRVAIAACCAGANDIFLLDEPTRGMDDVTKRLLIEQLQHFADQGGAVLIATHDVELAASIASRVVLLAEGQVVVDAAPEVALTGSITFSTQMSKVFGRNDLMTVDDVLKAVGS